MVTSLALMDANKRALAVRMILENEGAENAETALVALAESQGDSAVAIVLGDMRPIDLNKLVRDFDYTKSSIAIELIEPLKAAELLKSESLMWDQQVIQSEPEKIRDEATSLICQLVLVNETDDRRRAFIEAIAETDWGSNFLRFIFLCRDDALWFFKHKTFDQSTMEMASIEQVTPGDCQELLFVMSDLTPIIFKAVGEDVSRDMQAIEELTLTDQLDDEEEEVQYDPIKQFLVSRIRELRELAGSKETEIEDEDTLQLR